MNRISYNRFIMEFTKLIDELIEEASDEGFQKGYDAAKEDVDEWYEPPERD